MIYFDCAATSLHKPPCVKEAVLQALEMASPNRGAYPAALEASRLVYHCREQVADLFGVPNPKQVAFTSGITESLNLAIYGLLQAGDHVITTALEHNSVLRPLYRMQENHGIELSILPADRMGQIDLQMLPQVLRKNTKAVICTHASNVTGTVVDIAAIGAFCKAHNLFFILDTAQTAGIFPVHLQRDGISVLCFTGHKTLLAPQGIGGLCVAESVKLRPVKVGGSGVQSFLKTQPCEMPTVLEAGTPNLCGIAGLSAALSYRQSTDAAQIAATEQARMRQFYDGIRTLPQIQVYGDVTKPKATVISLNLGQEDAAWVSDTLAQEFDICTRSGVHCAPLMHQALGTAAQGTVRFSFSHWNTEAEIETAVAALRTLSEV